MKRHLLLLILLAFTLSACGGNTATLSEPVRAKITDDGKSQKIDILVDHAYKPNNIVLKSGLPTTINFYRREKRESCAGEVVIPELDINVALPNNEKKSVDLPPLDAGKTIPFHCSMNMMTGQILVLDGES